MLKTFARMQAVARWNTLPDATTVIWVYTTFAMPFTVTLILNLVHSFLWEVPDWVLWVATVWFTLNAMSIFVYYHMRQCGFAIDNHSVAPARISSFHIGFIIVYLPIAFALEFLILQLVHCQFGWVMYLQFACVTVSAWCGVYYFYLTFQHHNYYDLRRGIMRNT